MTYKNIVNSDVTYEAAMIPVKRPGFFSRADVRKACDFIINNEPPAHVGCDHAANVKQATVVKWAMNTVESAGE